MDALLPCPDQPDTPHRPQFGITHLGDDWLAAQYRKAAEAIDAQLLPGSITAGAR
jgi:hypothetical protein